MPSRGAAKGLAAHFGFVRRFHSGLFPLWEGYYRSLLVVVAECHGDEDVHYACVRHVAHLYRLSCALLVEPVIAVAEDLSAGDVVVARAARRYYCPTALPGNLDAPDDLVFRGNVREWVQAPPVSSSAELLSASAEERNGRNVKENMDLRLVVVGSSPRPLRGWHAPEFVRTRFGVHVVDSGAYSFLSACAAIGLPSSVIGVVEKGITRQPGAALSAATTSKRLADIARAMLEQCLERPEFAPRPQ